jgi:hypothetical protein
MPPDGTRSAAPRGFVAMPGERIARSGASN